MWCVLVVFFQPRRQLPQLVRGWRYRETLQYVTKIEGHLAEMKGEELPP